MRILTLVYRAEVAATAEPRPSGESSRLAFVERGRPGEFYVAEAHRQILDDCLTGGELHLK